MQVDALLAERKIYASTMPMEFIETCLYYLRLQLHAQQLKRAFLELVVPNTEELAVRLRLIHLLLLSSSHPCFRFIVRDGVLRRGLTDDGRVPPRHGGVPHKRAQPR